MDCQTARERLSAFVDEELHDGAQRKALEDHLERCPHCAAERDNFVAIGELARSPIPVPSEIMWRELAKRVNSGENPSLVGRTSWWQAGISRRWALAASLLLVATVGWTGYRWAARKWGNSMPVADLSQFLDQFENDPDGATELLVTQFRGEAIDLKSDATELGFKPLSGRLAANGLSIQTSHVLNMPCCRCVHCTCHSDDNKALTVLEHAGEQPVSFGHRPIERKSCGGRDCQIVRVGSRLAVSWKEQGRRITVVGLGDLSDVEQLMAKFGGG